VRAVQNFEKACRAGIAASCFSVAQMYRSMKDEALARDRFRQACDVSTRNVTASTAYFRPGSTAQPATAPAFCSQADP
jgi:TPR repeat protein